MKYFKAVDTADDEVLYFPEGSVTIVTDVETMREEMQQKINQEGQCVAEADRCGLLATGLKIGPDGASPISGLLDEILPPEDAEKLKAQHQNIHAKNIERYEKRLQADAIFIKADGFRFYVKSVTIVDTDVVLHECVTNMRNRLEQGKDVQPDL